MESKIIVTIKYYPIGSTGGLLVTGEQPLPQFAARLYNSRRTMEYEKIDEEPDEADWKELHDEKSFPLGFIKKSDEEAEPKRFCGNCGTYAIRKYCKDCNKTNYSNWTPQEKEE